MTSVTRSALLALALCIGIGRPGHAQKALTEVPPDRMAQILTSMGLELQERKEAGEQTMLRIELASYSASLILANQNTDAQLYAWFKGKLKPEKANEWNKRHRFARAYVDDDGDAVLESDIDFTGGVTEANIKAWIKLYRDQLGAFAAFLD